MSPAQHAALRALLAGANIAQAARAARVRRSTASKWFNHNAAFQLAYSEGKHEIERSARAVLAGAATDAAKVLRQALKDRRASWAEKIRAAQLILDALPREEIEGELLLDDPEPEGLG